MIFDPLLIEVAAVTLFGCMLLLVFKASLQETFGFHIVEEDVSSNNDKSGEKTSLSSRELISYIEFKVDDEVALSSKLSESSIEYEYIRSIDVTLLFEDDNGSFDNESKESQKSVVVDSENSKALNAKIYE
uniref:ATP synthase F0 subunit 8 n=1 Tax=Panagrolaimus sp. PS1159 TaxID=55785 RepID=A0AC35GLK7_9BILA